MRYLATLLGLFTLIGCAEGIPQAQPRAPEKVGQATNGADIYRFRLTRSNALGVTPVSNAAINRRALEICPGGYRELGRAGQAERRISGVIYVDVDVTIICQ